MIDFSELSKMVKKCIELGFKLPNAGNFENSDIIKLVQRKSLVNEIQNFIFKPSYYTVGHDNLAKNTPINENTTVSLEPVKGYRFSKNYKYGFVTSTRTETTTYSMTMPLLQDNAELFLVGIASVSDPYSMFNYLEYGLSVKSKGTKREKKLYFRFSDSRTNLETTKAERAILYMLETDFILTLARLNIVWMQTEYPEQIEDFDLLQVWSSMIVNCRNFNDKEFKNISIHEDWLDFTIFSEWSRKNGYTLGSAFERISENSNYDPSTAIWNRSSKRYPYSHELNSRDHLPFPETYFLDYTKTFGYEFLSISLIYEVSIEYEGQVKPFSEWLKEIGFSSSVMLVMRSFYQEALVSSQSVAEKKEVYTNKEVEINGETKTIKEWSELSGISVKTLISRIRYGWEPQNLLQPPRELKRSKHKQ